MPLGIKTGPTPGVRSWNQRNKDVEFICWENDSGERSRAIMALLSTLPRTKCVTLVTFILLSTKSFKLDLSKILSFGKELILIAPNIDHAGQNVQSYLGLS